MKQWISNEQPDSMEIKAWITEKMPDIYIQGLLRLDFLQMEAKKDG